MHPSGVFDPVAVENQNIVPDRLSEQQQRVGGRPRVLRLELIVQKRNASGLGNHNKVAMLAQPCAVHAFEIAADNNVSTVVNMGEKRPTPGPDGLNDNAAPVGDDLH